MIYIESKDNKIYKELKKLKNKRYRLTYNRYLIEGLRFVEEAVKSEVKIIRLIMTEEFYNKHAEDLDIFTGISMVLLKDSLFNELSDTEKPQGIIAEVEMMDLKPEIKDGIFILVDRIQDPGNLGTIIRTAEAVGALGIICTKGTVDYLNEKVLRSTMGAVFRMPIILEEEDMTFIKTLKENGFKLLGTTLQTNNSVYDCDLSGRIVICIGNEGNGISSEVLDLCDMRAKIPMPGKAESLNAAIAASVIIFEALRQRLMFNA